MFPFIHIGGLDISTWRVVVVTGVVLCWIIFLMRARKLGYSFYTVFPWLLFGLPVGTLGAHFFGKLIPALAGADNAAYSLTGLTVIGSIFCCLLFSFFYIKYIMKMPPMQVLDASAFAFPLSIFIGRMGCLLNGCCYGKIAPDWVKPSLLSLVTIPVGLYVEPSSAWRDYLGVPHDRLAWNLPLLLMINVFFVLIVTETMYRNRIKWDLYPGTVFAATSTLYAGGRFFIEFMRKEDVVDNALFNPWQLALLVLFFASLLWLCVCLYRWSQNLSMHSLKEELP